jgi:hypothetical protein
MAFVKAAGTQEKLNKSYLKRKRGLAEWLK